MLGARDATNVRIEYELGGNMVVFARINHFPVVNLDIMDTACVDIRLARNSSLARGGATTRPPQSTVLLRMLPGRETVVVDVDTAVALMGAVYCGQDGFPVRKDGCVHDSR